MTIDRSISAPLASVHLGMGANLVGDECSFRVWAPNAISATTCRSTIMSLHHDRQTSRHPKTTFTGQLVCPHCQTAFPVTWRRYWAAPLGNYRCLWMSANLPCHSELLVGTTHRLRHHDISCNHWCFVWGLCLSQHMDGRILDFYRFFRWLPTW